MLLDLDNFKFVNDSHGHYVGDILLKQFGLRLGQALRPMDIVARIGGDEFLVLFASHYPSIEQFKEILQLVMDRICDQLQEVFELEGNIKVNIKPSIGVVIFGKDIGGFEELMKFADLAMYSNKSNPMERYRFYDQSLHDEFLQTSEMNNGLIEACVSEQFYVDYQPIVNRAKETIAFEALARWNHPNLGKVMPDIFIPFAEKNGHIRAVSHAIFKKIFSSPQVPQLKQSAQPLSLMINISGNHLMDANFADDFISTAESFDFPLDLIHLEVTESVFLDDKEQSIQMMKRLKEKGIKFALDDFGTGYSSFSYLQKLPINYLKIDKSFVASMNQIEDFSIVENIINLAHTLHLEVIAEGVETEEQFKLLHEMNCNYFQGWYFGRPGPIPLIK
jgi:diguanylate cyclase (GGDEF)-like protein